jgi:hypothetical protein
MLNGIAAVSAEVLSSRLEFYFGLAALPQGIVDVRMKLTGCYIYSPGLGDCR